MFLHITFRFQIGYFQNKHLHFTPRMNGQTLEYIVAIEEEEVDENRTT
jgi:hypothetical protein